MKTTGNVKYSHYILVYCPLCGGKIKWGIDGIGIPVPKGEYEILYAPAILIELMQNTIRGCDKCLEFFVAKLNFQLRLKVVRLDGKQTVNLKPTKKMKK